MRLAGWLGRPFVAVSVVAGLVGITFVVTSTVLLLQGLAAAIAVAMPTSFAWVGPLLVGLLGVALALGGVWLMMRMMAKARHFPLRDAESRCYSARLPERNLFRGSSVVEQPTVNRLVVGSNPTRGATRPSRLRAPAARSRPSPSAPQRGCTVRNIRTSSDRLPACILVIRLAR